MVAHITVYGGAGEIGGNQIEISDGGASIWLDFGCPMSRRSALYGDFQSPRSTLGLTDLIATGLAPLKHGIYRQDMLPGSLSDLAGGPKPLAVLLSHAHLDHSGYISFIDPAVPVYSSLQTAILAKATQDSASLDMESEVSYCVPREQKQGLLAASHYKREPATRRAWYAFGEVPRSAQEFWCKAPGARELVGPEVSGVTGDEVGIGPFRVRHFPVDHSVPGASAWAVKTSAGWVAYTGDFRFHGANSNDSLRMVDGLADLSPSVLICEGTNVTDTWPTSERAVAANALAALRLAKHAVFVDCGSRNLERLSLFAGIARQLGRRLCVTPREYYLFSAMQTTGYNPIPEMDLVMFTQYSRLNMQTWERITVERFQGDQFTGTPKSAGALDQLVLSLGFYDIDCLIDLEPKGGTYLRSTSEAWDEEGRADLERLHNWLAMYGVALLGGGEDTSVFHSSGHSGAHGLRYLVDRVKPEIVVPVHTKTSRAWKGMGNYRTIFPARGKPFKIG